VASAEPDRATLIAWDQLVSEVPGSDVTQLSGWSRVRTAAGFTPFYVMAYQGAELVGGAHILQRRLPMFGTLGYVPYGPVIAPHVPRDPVRRLLGQALTELTRRGIAMLFVQPPEGADDVSSDLLSRGFRLSDAGIAPTASVRVDLSASEAELQRGLSRSLRKWTRTNKWEAGGVTVRWGDETDIAVMAELLARTAGHHRFEALTEEYLRTLYRELAPTGHARLALGEIDGVPVHSVLYTSCSGALKTRLSGFDRTGEATRLRVPGAVRWEGIRWAKANGHRWFDLGGLTEASQRMMRDGNVDQDDLPGADKFKFGFGGTPFTYPPAVELIGSPILRGAYDLARRWHGGKRLISMARLSMRTGRLRGLSEYA
jgi:lipid II:glycine glycyltransferase (peptidoglycan interpeptide bridge formation enzyme)